ncbi:MAG: hypothetical protein II916_05830 [Oscillospiraceae bacterium]|nr:hypothetical protein [Oscillospiraceae bacterium]
MIIINPNRGEKVIWAFSGMGLGLALEPLVSYLVHGKVLTLAEMNLEKELVQILLYAGGGVVFGYIAGFAYEKWMERTTEKKLLLKCLEVLILMIINAISVMLWLTVDRLTS